MYGALRKRETRVKLHVYMIVPTEEGSVPVREDIAKNQHGNVLYMEVPGMLGTLHSGYLPRDSPCVFPKRRDPLSTCSEYGQLQQPPNIQGPCTLAAGSETCLLLPTKLPTSLLDILVMQRAARGLPTPLPRSGAHSSKDSNASVYTCVACTHRLSIPAVLQINSVSAL